MKIFLAVAAVLLLVTLVWFRKRNAKKAVVAVGGSGEQAKPLTVAPKPASKRVDSTPKRPEVSAVDVSETPSRPAVTESQPLGSTAPGSSSSFSKRPEQIPEDSTLRRHYLSSRQADKEAISHPYPTDSTLRRHHESMLAMALRQSETSVSAETSAQLEPVAVCKFSIPEDSTLRRHFLTQLRAEIESQLSARPTDSTLRRHYDSQVEAKLAEYLAQSVA